MEISQETGGSLIDNRLQNVIQGLSNLKKEFLNEKEECIKVKELNTKLEVELKEAEESEKSHRYHLLTSREMIGNLQETVSQLVYLKRDVKKLKDELISKDITIAALEKEKKLIIERRDENIMEIRNDHEKYIEDLTLENEKKFQQKQIECDTQIAQLTCVIEELRSKIKDMEMENRSQMNAVVLEYEEKIQRGEARIVQLQEQLAQQATRTDANIDVYRRRLEELEEKLRQSQFKQFLAQNIYTSHYENKVERPYSANRDPYPGTSSANFASVLEVTNPNVPTTNIQNRALKPSKIHTMTPNITKTLDKKGPFNITKKRKLYTDKGFTNF